MARLPRYVIPGQAQHIIQRGNNRQGSFGANGDYQFSRDALVEAAEKHRLAIHVYVWMTSHVHLLAAPDADEGISKTFQSVGRRYVQYFNHVYKRGGTLWEGRYRATVVDSEQLMRYSELNPVRASMVALPQDYPWSSYRRNALGEGGKNADWLSPHAEYRRLGREDVERQAAYRALFVASIDAGDLTEIHGCTHKGWASGDSCLIPFLAVGAD